jgi:hypothetical protein
MKYLADINKLKFTVLQTKDFKIAWNEFFDLTMQPQFLAKSRRSQLKNLEVILNEICKVLISDNTGKLQAPLILRYEDSDFYHGPLVGVGKTGSFMYFKDSGTGMAALITGGDNNTEYCRFMATTVRSPHCYSPLSYDNAHGLRH